MRLNIDGLLNSYGSVFTKPQFNHFSHMVKSLIICEKPSIQRFSYIHNRDRSNLNRFLTESLWDFNTAKELYQKQVNESLSPGSSLLIDDSISHRPYAKKVEKLNTHYDHTTGGHSLGYSIVTAVIQSKGFTIPYDLECYYRLENCTDITFQSKNEIAAKIIQKTKSINHIRTIIFDSWYSNKIVIGACKEADKDFITMIKSDRNVTIGKIKMTIRAYVKHIKKKQWAEIELPQGKFRIFATSAFISKIGSVHLVFCQRYEKKKWGRTHYLISNMMDTPSVSILAEYLTRSGIEVFHREAKQNTGLEGYFLRKNRGIERYLFLVLVAYGLMTIQAKLTQKNITIGKITEKYKSNMFEQAFETIQKQPHLKELICQRLAMARV